MNAVEINNIDFYYGRRQILKNLSLHVPSNSIYGLLGRNGSGKSTTLKLLLMLLPSKKGSIQFWGENNYDHTIFYRIGSLIETPPYYGYLTVEEHLKLLSIIFNKDEYWVDYILDTVDLNKNRKQKASKLSTGQKQRLGIAMALFRDPDLLVLDEPINGLDPLGIIEIRELLLKLNKEGKTIILSSHIISEMEKLCTHIGIIEKGQLQFEGAIGEIKDGMIEEFYLNILKSKL